MIWDDASPPKFPVSPSATTLYCSFYNQILKQLSPISLFSHPLAGHLLPSHLQYSSRWLNALHVTKPMSMFQYSPYQTSLEQQLSRFWLLMPLIFLPLVFRLLLYWDYVTSCLPKAYSSNSSLIYIHRYGMVPLLNLAVFHWIKTLQNNQTLLFTFGLQPTTITHSVISRK